MGEVLKIDLTVEPEIAAEIDSAIASGDYSDIADLVSDVLANWHAARHEDQDRLRRLWQEGLASGEPVEGNFDVDDIHRRGMERLKALRS